MAMTRGHKVLVALVVILAAAPAAILSVRFVAKIYLQKHHSTLLGTAFSLIAPPSDIYSVVWCHVAERGTAETSVVTFHYAGAHHLRLVGGEGENDMNGYLECESMKVDLHFEKRNYSHTEGNYILASFKVDGDMVGKPLQCRIFIAGAGPVHLEIKKISDV